MASPGVKDTVLVLASSAKRVWGVSQCVRAEKLTGMDDGSGSGVMMSEPESEQAASRSMPKAASIKWR